MNRAVAVRAPDTHQAGQAALAALVVRHMAAAWRLLDVSRLTATLPQLVQAIAALTASYGRSSGAMAAELYDVQRAEAGIRGRFTVPVAGPPELEQIDAGVRWATKDLYSAKPDVDAARTLTEGVAQQAVLDVGRQTIVDAVQADKQARGWARTVEPGACYWCLMLATRGAVYKSEQTADFRSHGHCRCAPEPVFTAYEPTAELRQWQRIYADVTAGKSGKAARTAFRTAVEQHRA